MKGSPFSSDDCMDNFHLTLQFHSALWIFRTSFSALFWFAFLQFFCLGSVFSTSFPLKQSAVTRKKGKNQTKQQQQKKKCFKKVKEKRKKERKKEKMF